MAVIPSGVGASGSGVSLCVVVTVVDSVFGPPPLSGSFDEVDGEALGVVTVELTVGGGVFASVVVVVVDGGTGVDEELVKGIHCGKPGWSFTSVFSLCR